MTPLTIEHPERRTRRPRGSPAATATSPVSAEAYSMSQQTEAEATSPPVFRTSRAGPRSCNGPATDRAAEAGTHTHPIQGGLAMQTQLGRLNAVLRACCADCEEKGWKWFAGP